MKNRTLILSVMFLAFTAMAGAKTTTKVMTFATPGVVTCPENHPDLVGKIADVAARVAGEKYLEVSFRLIREDQGEPSPCPPIRFPRIFKRFSLQDKAAAYGLYDLLKRASLGKAAASGTFELVSTLSYGGGRGVFRRTTATLIVSILYLHNLHQVLFSGTLS